MTQWKLPDEMILRLPFGFKVKVLKRRLTPADHGDWLDFNNSRVGILRIRRSDPYDVQIDTLVHEMHHALTDWSNQALKYANEYREAQQEDKD